MSDRIVLSGHCLCGAVTYSISAEPVVAGHCACDNCRHGTGCEHASLFAVPAGAATVTGRTTAYVHSADSGAIVTRHFCPVCGSPVFSENERLPTLRMFAAGTLDRIDRFTPSLFVYHGKAAPFDRAAEGMAVFEAMPPEVPA